MAGGEAILGKSPGSMGVINEELITLVRWCGCIPLRIRAVPRGDRVV